MRGKREGFLLVAGMIIAAVTFWRINQLEQWKSDPTRVAASVRSLAPRFTLADHNRNVVKLERLIGRHRVVLVFFDADLGVDRDPRTSRLIDSFQSIDDAGIEILAVSSSTPFANEEAEKRLGREIPFPVLTDIDITNPVPLPAHRLYGLVDASTSKPQTGLFLIERDGTVPFGQTGLPMPVEDEQSKLDALSQGNWPN